MLPQALAQIPALGCLDSLFFQIHPSILFHCKPPSVGVLCAVGEKLTQFVVESLIHFS